MKKWTFILLGSIFGGLYIIKKVTRKMETGVLVWQPKKEEETEEAA